MTTTSIGIILRGLVTGLLGGGLFFWIGLPLPWVMGAMFATILTGIAGWPGHMPRSVRNAVIPTLGVMFGASFDGQAMAYISELWLLIPLTLVYLTVIIGVGCIWFTKAGRLDLPTAYFASVPGSFSEMLFVAEDRKADLSSVAIVHSTRLVISMTLITVGFRTILGIDTNALPASTTVSPGPLDLVLLIGCAVVGYFGGKAIRLPSAHLFGPLILSAVAHLAGLVEGAPPGWTAALAQIFIGIFIGLRFEGVRFAAVRRLLILSVLWAMFLLVTALGVAEIAVLILDLPFAAALLAFAPGGAVEISVVALAAGVSLSLVTIIQFIRITLTVLLAPLAIRWLPGAKQRD